MKKRKVKLKIRKAHRYLGIILGVQFLFWTISGMYFSWTDLNNIHGDHLKNLEYIPKTFNNLISPSDLKIEQGVYAIEIRDINNTPYYWINKTKLYNAYNGNPKEKNK